MSKADLRKASGVSPNTMTNLRRDEPVMLNVLDKICKILELIMVMLCTTHRIKKGSMNHER